MIKYNNKERSHHDLHLDCIQDNRSNQLSPQICKMIRKSQGASSNQRRGSAFQSPQRQRLNYNHNLFPQRRSKSHKINYQKANNSKLKNEIFKKRQGKINKMDLLVIIPNKEDNSQPDIHKNKQTCFDNLLLKNSKGSKFTENPKLQTKCFNKSTIKQDIANGKMKLLSHKSKLSPITDHSKDCRQQRQIYSRQQRQIYSRQQRQIYRSDERLIQVQKIQTTYYHQFIRQRQREVREKYHKNEKNKTSPSIERYLKLSSEIKPNNLINIQSIVPNISIAEKITLQLKTKDKRRTTQPNLDSAQQFYKVAQDSLDTLYDKKMKQCFSNLQLTGNQFNFNNGRQRIKYVADKLQSSKWKKKIFLSHLTKFIVPYQTYYYRDMLWKVNYSNNLLVEPPLQYEHRLKAYVGKGNNSSMVRGLISRRYWFAVTDRLQQANFVWTQLKEFKYFNVQKSTKNTGVNTDQNKCGTYASKNLLLNEDISEYKKYCERNKVVEQHSDERMHGRSKCFSYSLIIRGHNIKEGRLHNHLINNYIISNKKSLFRVLSSYYKFHEIDPFNVVPITYHVTKGIEDPVFLAFQRFYHLQAKQIRRGQSNRHNFWIVKPGQNSNRGNGIKLCFKLSEIKAIVKQVGVWGDGSQKTHIIQSYIQNPLLYYKRKFDLRHYILVTCVNGQIKGYWYSDGYVRTTSSEYTLQFSGNNVHLTNDAIQKFLPNYGKYEKGNKLSYTELDAYIRKKSPNHGFYVHVYPQMRKIAIDIMRASAVYLDPNKLSNNFQLFGLDFMIDDRFKVWLIEVNSNPCLELSCPLLSRIIPNLIENVLLTMDAHFPPAVRYSAKIPRYLGKTQDLNKFQLVFDERIQAMMNFEQNLIDDGLLKEQDDQFEDNNSEWQDNV